MKVTVEGRLMNVVSGERKKDGKPFTVVHLYNDDDLVKCIANGEVKKDLSQVEIMDNVKAEIVLSEYEGRVHKFLRSLQKV